MFIFILLFLIEFIFSKNYTIEEKVSIYGTQQSKISLTSYSILFFAAYNDIKEILYTLKKVIPYREKYIPLITLDSSEEVKALFVGNYTIPLESITEFHPFHKQFIIFCLIGYCIGVFPWCLLATILREEYLDYATMRIITPTLGSIMLIRSLLGSGFVVKGIFALSFLFDYRFEKREEIGKAIQTLKTEHSAYTTAFATTILFLVFCSLLTNSYWLGVFVVIVLFGSFIYGSFTGCMHVLPIRPWMCKLFLLSILLLL
jgi:hypothetical protein